ncbi:MAG: long-chain fatty acid--CoA ligase [Anaerolineae bacterium]|nr:long-chain fatty acid--CoA ligase [Anaerolineae bacterium]
MQYSDKPWVKQYDPGVPATLHPYPAQPLHQFVRNSAQKKPNNVAIVSSAHLPVVGRQKAELTYRELDTQSDALAVALGELGVKKGDRVAIILPNCAQFVIAFFAILKAGAIVCATNPTYPAAKMQYQLKDCGANTVITLSLFYNTVKQIQKDTDVKNVIVANIKEYLPPLAAFLFTIAKEKKEGHRVEIQPGDHRFPDLIQRGAGRKPNVEVKATDIAIFQYTGGTTGVPKAAMATHQALVCNVLQCHAWLGQGDEHASLLTAIPLFHVYGMVAVMSFAAHAAYTLLMVPNPRDIKEVLEVIHAYKPTFYHGVPGMYNLINNHPDVAAGKYDIKSIRICISGSAPLPPVTKRRFEELTGGTLVEGFGMSETPTVATVNPLVNENRTGSIGLPVPDTEIRIVSLDDGVTDVPLGDVGELCIYGPQLMSGYYNLPTETTNALRPGPDGKKWLHTGDIARMDEQGYIYIVDRKKDMALIGGFNVYPNNVEKVLAEHPAVQDVGVAAIPHPDKAGQEALKAWIVLKPGQSATEQDIIDFAGKMLARYEVPTRIQFVPELPKTTVGKVLRRELVQMEMAQREKQEQPVR